MFNLSFKHTLKATCVRWEWFCVENIMEKCLKLVTRKRPIWFREKGKTKYGWYITRKRSHPALVFNSHSLFLALFPFCNNSRRQHFAVNWLRIENWSLEPFSYFGKKKVQRGFLVPRQRITIEPSYLTVLSFMYILIAKCFPMYIKLHFLAKC